MDKRNSKESNIKNEGNDELTNAQLENLEKFLKKTNYSKEELVTEREMGLHMTVLVEEEWIRSSKKNMKQILQYLIQKFDLNWLISKIAFDFYVKYDKTISQGQAEAVIRRVLDIKLSSTGRSQLHELRKKIRRYDKFLTYFGEWSKYMDFTLKILIMGLNFDQKSKLFTILAQPAKIQTQKISIGVEFYTKMVEIYNKIVELQIWDISGETKFKFLRSTYFKGSHGVIITYDKGDLESFKLAKEYYVELKKATNLKFKLRKKKGVYGDISIILIGLGDSKVINSEEGQSFAKEIGAKYYEITETEEEIFEEALTYLSFQIITKFQRLKGKGY